MLVIKHPGHPDQSVHNPHKDAQAAANLDDLLSKYAPRTWSDGANEVSIENYAPRHGDYTQVSELLFGKVMTPQDFHALATSGNSKLPPGVSARTNVEIKSPIRLTMRAHLIDANGHMVAEIERDFVRTDDGLSVEHNGMVVNPSYQKQGFGSQFFFASEDKYREMGVSEIRLKANNDVGGYAWARMGFDFADDSGRITCRTALISQCLDKFSKDPRFGFDELNQLYGRVGQLQHPYEFAAFSVRVGESEYTIGKDAMLRTKWLAVKSLKNDDDPCVQAGQAFRRKAGV